MRGAKESYDIVPQDVRYLQAVDLDVLNWSVQRRFLRRVKRLVQLSLLEQKLCIIDQTDSGIGFRPPRVVANRRQPAVGASRDLIVITLY